MPKTRSSPKVVQARYIMIGGFLGAGKTTAVGKLAQRLKDEEADIVVISKVAHMKMTLSPEGSLSGEIAGINRVRNDSVPELSFQPDAPVKNGQLIINLRAEAALNVLGAAVREGLAATARKFPGLTATVDHLEHFRPGKPTPTHRIEALPA